MKMRFKRIHAIIIIVILAILAFIAGSLLWNPSPQPSTDEKVDQINKQ